MTENRHAFFDSMIMFKRCGLISIRKVDALITAIIIPAMMMLLFVFVFGGAINVGDYDFVSFIVPGIILQCVGQCASFTSMSVNEDLTKGVFDRFRSMPIAKSAVLIGHVLASVVRNMLSTTVVIVIAMLIGFRPVASPLAWFAIVGMLLLYMLAITWISVLFGIIAQSPESAGGLAIFATILPYFSSGFVSVDTIAPVLQGFARNQPMTKVIDTVRALFLGMPVGDSWISATVWCVGIIVCFQVASVWLYSRKISK